MARRTVEKLVSNREWNQTLGNHKVVQVGEGIRHFIYFSTVICIVNDWTKKFWTGDPYGSPSTKKANTCYRGELAGYGYSEVTKEEIEGKVLA
jgi:hypothetical protein